MKKQKLRIRVFIAVVFASLLVLPFVANVSATATISPSTASGLLNMSTPFTASGLSTTDTFSVKLGDVTVLTGLQANSQGELSFSVTATTAGTFTVGVYNSTSALQCSASLIVTDLLGVIVPPLVLLIGVTILFGMSKEMGKL